MYMALPTQMGLGSVERQVLDEVLMPLQLRLAQHVHTGPRPTAIVDVVGGRIRVRIEAAAGTTPKLTRNEL